MERVTLILKPEIINELRSLLPNLTAWLIRRKVTPCFLNNEKGILLMGKKSREFAIRIIKKLYSTQCQKVQDENCECADCLKCT